MPLSLLMYAGLYMKRFFALFFLASPLVACTVENDYYDYDYYQPLPRVSIERPYYYDNEVPYTGYHEHSRRISPRLYRRHRNTHHGSVHGHSQWGYSNQPDYDRNKNNNIHGHEGGSEYTIHSHR